MRAVTFVEPGRAAIVDVPEPTPRPGEVLVRVHAAGICQTDVHIRSGLDRRVTPNTILGHEIAGVIAATAGDDLGRVAGDAVVVYPVWSCGRCAACAAGRQNACDGTTGRLRTPPTPGVSVDGGMAEFIAVPSRNVVPTGDLDPRVAATMADAGLSPYASIQQVRGRLGPGGWAVVIGVGGLGSMAVQILRATTATRIAVVDASAEAIQGVTGWADASFPADAPELARTILETTGGGGADAVFDYVGSDTTLELAMDVVAPYGAVQVSGMAGGSLRLTADASCRIPRGATIAPRLFSGTYSELGEVVQLAQRGILTPTIVPYPFEEAIRALDDLEHGLVHGRAILDLR